MRHVPAQQTLPFFQPGIIVAVGSATRVKATTKKKEEEDNPLVRSRPVNNGRTARPTVAANTVPHRTTNDVPDTRPYRTRHAADETTAQRWWPQTATKTAGWSSDDGRATDAAASCRRPRLRERCALGRAASAMLTFGGGGYLRAQRRSSSADLVRRCCWCCCCCFVRFSCASGRPGCYDTRGPAAGYS